MSGITPIKKVLTELSKLPKVIGVFVVSKEGFVIESITSREAFDEEALAAMATAALGSIEALGRELDLGKPEIATLEYSGAIVLAYDLGENLVILVAEKGAVLGRLRYELKKNIPRITAAL
ncbi:MAG: roadblock/LC7 domain-containing protein [Crenarchaeota archaeon]|nr:roadblock/LC7 domain-containing protein [Thermoproteota archaeon]